MTNIPENNGIEAGLFESLIKLNRDCPYHGLLGIKIKSLAPGRACIYLNAQEKLNNLQDMVHGGVTFSLTDTAMGIAIRTLGQICVTLESNINYVRPAKSGETIYAAGRVVRMGKTTIICDCEVTNADNDLIAISRGTYYNITK